MTIKPRQNVTANLRILQTTDLHMHLLGYDYYADRPDPRRGMAALADIITALRKDPTAETLLFDNGDFLQGNPLADDLAATALSDSHHPLAEVFNLLGYDAVTLGNHEFDYGPALLQCMLAGLACPTVSANVTCRKNSGMWQPFALLPRGIRCSDGRRRKLTIGVTGFAPPQITGRSLAALDRPVDVADIPQTARRIVPLIRAAGADIVIALCHSGLGHDTKGTNQENAGLTLAKVAGLDVLLLGHSHDTFPQDGAASDDAIAHDKGTINGKPAVMARFHGQSLGDITLNLRATDAGWRIAGQTVTLHQPDAHLAPRSPTARAIEVLANPHHKATLSRMRAPVGHTAERLHNYFATITPDPVARVVAEAMRTKVRQALPDLALPLLAAVAPSNPGGAADQSTYIDIAAGPVTARDLAAISPFADHLCATIRNGAALKEWLTRAASHYNRITLGKSDQPLITTGSAGYLCDALYGLEYRIDLTAPAKGRITDIRLNGHPLQDHDRVVVATTSFRAAGGGGFPKVRRNDLLWRSDQTLRDILGQSLAKGQGRAEGPAPAWSFTPHAGTSVTFQTSTLAIPLAPPHWQVIDSDDRGMTLFRIPL